MNRRLGKALAIAAWSLFFAACDVFPAKTQVDDPRLGPMWRAAADFERERYGFSPLPTHGAVKWERAHHASYDAMLHQGGETYRTIAFIKTAEGYRWVGEQESFEGPSVFHTADGDQHERIVLTYDALPVSGAPLNSLYISYDGQDRRLSGREALTLSDVELVLAEWGYRSRGY